MSHVEYGRALNVPNIDPTAETIDGLHLWHLVEDVDLLHKLLSRQIVLWGQLRTLIDVGGPKSIELEDHHIRRIEAAGRAAEEACRLWRIGRGKPVDRVVLQDSGWVSDKFIDELSGLVKRMNGDAQSVIRELEDKEVSHWRNKNTENLRDYFEENGFFTTNRALSPDDIRIGVMAAVSHAHRGDVIGDTSIHRIVWSLFPHDAHRSLETMDADPI